MDRYLYSGDSIVGIVPPTEYELELEQRCYQLEQLCRGMYMMHTLEQHWQGAEPFEDFTHSMKELGLLEVDNGR